MEANLLFMEMFEHSPLVNLMAIRLI